MPENREIKKGSVLIIDVINFHKHEPSSLNQIADVLDDLYSTIANAVIENDGEVVKWLGDGALCAFWDGMHELCAVKAAVAIEEGFKAFAQRHGFTEESGVTIAIASGELIAGIFGTGNAKHYDVFGEPVACTATIMPAASGAITICEATQQALEDLVEVTQLTDDHYFGARFAIKKVL